MEQIEEQSKKKYIRNFTEEECNRHIQEAFKLWRERCQNDWNLDISLIEDNNIKLSRKLDKFERRKISIQTINSIN